MIKASKYSMNGESMNGDITPCGSGDILFFISHVTSYGNVITGSSLPCGVAISLVEIEI